MALFGGVTRFLDKYLFGYALGTAAGPSLQPFVQSLANAAWTQNQVMPPEYAVLADGVAREKVDAAWARDRAHEQGISDSAFAHLVDIARTAPPLGTAYQLWRRNLIDDGGFQDAVHDEGIPASWLSALRGLKRILLSPAELANAVVQGHRGFDAAAADAELQGVTLTDFQTMVDNTGLPPGPMDGLTMLRRGIISEAEFDQLVREGHTKVKYIAPLLALRDKIISGPEAAGLWLRGWLTEAEAKQRGALDGWAADEMELLYLNRGRPATTRQIHIGWARGGRLAGAADERAAFERGVRQSNIRTEYTDLLWAQRYTYPSAFVLRALVADGTFSQADGERILIESGWVPQYAQQAAAKWAGGAVAGVSSKWADRARSRLFTAAHDDYLDGNASDAEADALLASAGVAPGERQTVIQLWGIERARTRRDLTQAQILKLVKKGIWPREQGQAALEDLGMEPGDADDLLSAS